MGRIVAASESTLRILDSESLQILKTVILGGNVVGRPVFVQTDDTSWAVFISTANGVVSRVDAQTGTIEWQQNLTRSGCSNDSVGPVSVQLRRESSAAWRQRHTTDVVYVATAYSSCSGYNKDNMVYALSADAGLLEWTFNSGGTRDVDASRGAPLVDPSLDMVYLATDRTYDTQQDSLWALDSVRGTLEWSRNVGRAPDGVYAGGDRLYVTDMNGTVQAFDPFGGEIWSLPLHFAAAWREIEVVEGPDGRLLLLSGLDGFVRIVKDEGATGSLLWTTSLPGGHRAVTSVSGDSSHLVAYVGADDGAVYQIELLTGNADLPRVIDPEPTVIKAVTRPLLYWADTDGDRRGDTLRVIAGAQTGRLAMFCAPWIAAPLPVECPVGP